MTGELPEADLLSLLSIAGSAIDARVLEGMAEAGFDDDDDDDNDDDDDDGGDAALRPASRLSDPATGDRTAADHRDGRRSRGLARTSQGALGRLNRTGP